MPCALLHCASRLNLGVRPQGDSHARTNQEHSVWHSVGHCHLLRFATRARIQQRARDAFLGFIGSLGDPRCSRAWGNACGTGGSSHCASRPSGQHPLALASFLGTTLLAMALAGLLSYGAKTLVAWLLGAFLASVVYHELPPNNAFKPKPLRGSA